MIMCTYCSKGWAYWKRNHSHCPKIVIWNKSMIDSHQNGLQKEHHAPLSLPPQRTTLLTGGMLNQQADFSLTCIWTHGLYWEYYQTCLFFICFCSKKRAMEFYALSNPVAAVLSTSYGAVGDLTYSSDRLSSIVSGSGQSVVEADHNKPGWHTVQTDQCILTMGICEANYCFFFFFLSFWDKSKVSKVFKDDVKKFHKTHRGTK